MNYFVGSLNGDYMGYQKLKERIKLKASDDLWILGDIIDSNTSDPLGGVKILEDIQQVPNIHLIIGDHEFGHIMRYININNTEAYDVWCQYLSSLEISGDDLISVFEDMEEESEDFMFSYMIRECEISQLIRIGDNYFYATHGFPAKFDENYSDWQMRATSGVILEEDFIPDIQTDPSIDTDIKHRLTRKNCFVICAHQPISDIQPGNTGIYHKNGVFLLGENIPNEQIPVLAIDAAGYFFKNVLY